MGRMVSQGVGRFSQHYPKMAIIVTAQAGGKENAMAVAWHTSISYRPPIYGISVSPKRFTYQLIAASREFGVNFLPFEAAGLIAAVGGSRGEDIDKFDRFGIDRVKSVETAVPLLDAAYAAYECRLIDDQGYGDHRWLAGEIVAVHMLEEVFTDEELLDWDKVSPVLYLANDVYATVAKDTAKLLDRKVYGVST